jgi:hypothetical protein
MDGKDVTHAPITGSRQQPGYPSITARCGCGGFADEGSQLGRSWSSAVSMLGAMGFAK